MKTLLETYQLKLQSKYPFEMSELMVFTEVKFEKSQFLQESSIDNIIKIEQYLMENNIETAKCLWMNEFRLHDNFIHDVVLLGLFVEQKDFDLAMDIKIHWQKTLDKITEATDIIFFKGLYFMYLGQIFGAEEEYEISNAYLTKATLEFRKIFSNDDFVGIRFCQYQVATNYTELGANGEARYHYRELLDTFTLSLDEEINYSWFIYLTNKMSKNITKTKESLEFLIQLLNNHPLVEYREIRGSIDQDQM